MKIIKPSYEIVNEPNWDEVTTSLEKAIRTCYKSEKKIDAGTADRLLRSIIERGHESTLEHHSMTVRFVCDRGVSHELVRHRHCSFSQESTRYVNYAKEEQETEGAMQFILPCWLNFDTVAFRTDVGEARGVKLMVFLKGTTASGLWKFGMWVSEKIYNMLVNKWSWKPEQARSVLPNSLKTEIVVSTNMRDWRHIFHLRCDKTAHPQMRELMIPLYDELVAKCPTLFDSVQFNRKEGE